MVATFAQRSERARSQGKAHLLFNFDIKNELNILFRSIQGSLFCATK